MAYNIKWPVLDKFSMLLINNNRSKAYLQNLFKNDHKPSEAILLDSGNVLLPEHTPMDLKLHSCTNQKMIRDCKEASISFDEKENVQITLNQWEITYKILSTLDVNSPQVIQSVRECPGDYIVYSGPGGAILGQDILSTGKYFLHVHPGWLPNYLGSTTIYYSMLAGDGVGCSVIVLTEQIDKGPIFHRRRFQPFHNTNLDYVFDPAIRAATLIEFFNLNKHKSPSPILISERDKEESELFFIIHPVLKHLSILSLNNE